MPDYAKLADRVARRLKAAGRSAVFTDVVSNVLREEGLESEWGTHYSVIVKELGRRSHASSRSRVSRQKMMIAEARAVEKLRGDEFLD